MICPECNEEVISVLTETISTQKCTVNLDAKITSSEQADIQESILHLDNDCYANITDLITPSE